MKLSVLERFAVLGILPERGTLITMTVAKNIRNLVEPGEAEQEKLELRQVGDQLGWNPEAAKEMEIEVEWTGPQSKLLVEALEKLDKDGKLLTAHLSLCEKFGIGKA